MAKKETNSTENLTFLNPWEKGVSYKDFLESVPSGISISEHLTGKLGVENEAELIKWLEADIQIYTNNLKNK